MSFDHTTTLSSGAVIPIIGLGTWQSKPQEVGNAVEIAVRNGYRHLDLAMVYQNQNEVGAALKKVIPSVVKREELFITSKLWNSSHRPANVEKELDETLEQLGLDYVDLYLVHWPIAFAPENGLFPQDPKHPGYVKFDLEITLAETWKAMIALPKSKVRSIGVSNFGIESLKNIIAETGIVPAVNQVEAHPLLPQDDLVAYCKEQNIHITAYSPLGNNSWGRENLTATPEVKSIAEKLGVTPAQILIAWGVKRGYSVIPKSVQESRIMSNFKEVELSDEDYEAISLLKKDKYTRFNIPFTYCKPVWDIDIFGEPEEANATYKFRTCAIGR